MKNHRRNPMVFLPGWGLGVGPLVSIAQQLGGDIVPLPGYAAVQHKIPAIEDFEAACQSIANQLADNTVLCGWSLGGLLAQQIAATAPEKVSRLILISSTPSFVQRPGWGDATPLQVLDDFIDAIATNPANQSATLHQFVRSFNRGDKNSKAVTRSLLGNMSPLPDTSVLLAGLRWLRDIDLREKATTIQAPTLLLHGEHDPLMPLAGAQAFSSQLPNAKLQVLPDCAHAPFVSDPASVHASLAEFLGQTI